MILWIFNCRRNKAFGGEEKTIGIFRDMNGKLYESVWKSEFFSGMMMPLMGFIGNLGYVAVCAVGGVIALRGNITFGVVVAFTMYVRTFQEPLEMLSHMAMILQSTAAASERVFNFLDEAEMPAPFRWPRVRWSFATSDLDIRRKRS